MNEWINRSHPSSSTTVLYLNLLFTVSCTRSGSSTRTRSRFGSEPTSQQVSPKTRECKMVQIFCELQFKTSDSSPLTFVLTSSQISSWWSQRAPHRDLRALKQLLWYLFLAADIVNISVPMSWKIRLESFSERRRTTLNTSSLSEHLINVTCIRGCSVRSISTDYAADCAADGKWNHIHKVIIVLFFYCSLLF